MTKVFIDKSVLDDCANGLASYGMICVGCNCCGRLDEDEGISLSNEQRENRVKAWWKQMEESERLCPVCGNEEIDPEDKFCKICGKRLEETK